MDVAHNIFVVGNFSCPIPQGMTAELSEFEKNEVSTDAFLIGTQVKTKVIGFQQPGLKSFSRSEPPLKNRTECRPNIVVKTKPFKELYIFARAQRSHFKISVKLFAVFIKGLKMASRNEHVSSL
ncbi:MAG: hypothetical protein EOP09_09985 [Proteobacteria bacterium]|nr:MAG: hypothetical protein EOP09_09985 [Pseudomonadota bacterium]